MSLPVPGRRGIGVGGSLLLVVCCLAGPAVLGAVGGSLARNAIVAVLVAATIAIGASVVIRRVVAPSKEC